MTTLTEALSSSDQQLLHQALDDYASTLAEQSRNDFYPEQQREAFSAEAARALELAEAILDADELRLCTHPRP